MERRYYGLASKKYALLAALAAVLCLFSIAETRAGGYSALSPKLREELAYITGVHAFIYSYPLLHVNHFRYLYNSPESPVYAGPANSLNHSRVLSSSKNAAAASPNHNTL